MVDRAEMDRVHGKIAEVESQNASAVRDLDNEIRDVRKELMQHKIDGLESSNRINSTLNDMRLDSNKLASGVNAVLTRLEAHEKDGEERRKDERSLSLSIKRWAAITFLGVVAMYAAKGFLLDTSGSEVPKQETSHESQDR